MTYGARTISNLLLFNLGWWACAVGASQGHAGLGLIPIPFILGIHLRSAPVWRGELVFLIALAIVGFAVDTVLIQAHLFELRSGYPVAAGWIVGMWILFGQTFESMLALRRRLWLLCGAAAMTGPLSYYAGESLNLLTYARPLAVSLLLHGLLWALLIPALFKMRDYTHQVAQHGFRNGLSAIRSRPAADSVGATAPQLPVSPGAKPSGPGKF